MLASGMHGVETACRHARPDCCQGQRNSTSRGRCPAGHVLPAPAKPSAQVYSSGLQAIPTSCRFSVDGDEACCPLSTERSNDWRRLCHACRNNNGRPRISGIRNFYRRSTPRDTRPQVPFNARGRFIGRSCSGGIKARFEAFAISMLVRAWRLQTGFNQLSQWLVEARPISRSRRNYR